VDQTLQPYAYAGDNPANSSFPACAFPAGKFTATWCQAASSVRDGVRFQYWVSNLERHQDTQKEQGGALHFGIHLDQAPNFQRKDEIMNYHCYYCGMVTRIGFSVKEFEWTASDSGPGDDARPRYKKAGPDFQVFGAAGQVYGGPAAAADNAAKHLAPSIAIEFAAKVNKAIKGQKLNYEPIAKALLSGNSGRSLRSSLLALFNSRGGAAAKPSFDKPCLPRGLAQPASY
jgi:hypothetical protein